MQGAVEDEQSTEQREPLQRDNAPESLVDEAASCAKTIHRCPVGSHATVTPANPFARARSAAQFSAAPRSHALHRNVRRASTLE
jgi:hypothetical protein